MLTLSTFFDKMDTTILAYLTANLPWNSWSQFGQFIYNTVCQKEARLVFSLCVWKGKSHADSASTVIISFNNISL